MDVRTRSRYVIRPAADDLVGPITGEADDLDEALRAAWLLRAHYEAPVAIVERETEEEAERVVATVSVEWHEGR